MPAGIRFRCVAVSMCLKHLSRFCFAVTLFFCIILPKFSDAADDKAVDPWETEEPVYDEPMYEIPKGVQSLEFGGMNLNDEDQHSSHMPMELKCDGCRVVAYAIKETLKNYQKRYKYKKKLTEWDVVDLIDQVCQNKGKMFDGYGMKSIQGVRRLSGDALETKDVPGVSHGGGMWPYRLMSMCEEYVEVVGERAIYKQFLERKSIENIICRNKRAELGPICPPKKKRKGKHKIKRDEDEEEKKEDGQGTNQPQNTGENGQQPTEEAGASLPKERRPYNMEKIPNRRPNKLQKAQKNPLKTSKEQRKSDIYSQQPKEEKSEETEKDVKQPKQESKQSKEDIEKNTKEHKKSEEDTGKSKAGNTEKSKADSKKTKDETTKPKESTTKPEEDSKKPTEDSKKFQQDESKVKEDIKKPTKDIDEPKVDAKTTNEDAQMSKKDSKTSQEDAQKSNENTSKTTDTKKDAEKPAENTKKLKENVQKSTEDTKKPTEDVKQPEKDRIDSKENSEQPNKDKKMPKGEL